MIGNALIESVSRELGVVVGALLAVETTVEPASASFDTCWRVQAAVGGRLRGTLVLRFDAEASRKVARSIMGLAAPPPDPAVAETLQELCAQALAAVRRSTEAAGVS
ncbi:MAG: hypothetical protein HY654_05185, partial [Acidobacteria bacterium]|nr:hypothetical protein [Acidobacteriota bacterium]